MPSYQFRWFKKGRNNSIERKWTSVIEFGTFKIENCIIKKYEPSKFTHSKFNGGKTSYNFYVAMPENLEEDFFIIVNDFQGKDLRRAYDLKKPVSFSGTILKNPNSHKILYVVNENGNIEIEQA